MKYRCSECNFVFPCREAIDAYDEGIKRGFLCPSCKANIQELYFRGDSRDDIYRDDEDPFLCCPLFHVKR